MRLDRQTLRALGAASGIGFSIAASILLGIVVGRWVDQKLGIPPCGVVAGILVALTLAGSMIYELTTIIKGTDDAGDNHRNRSDSQ